MKAVFAFLTVNALFVFANALAAGAMLALGAWLKASPLSDEYWPWVAIILIGVAVGVGSAIWMAKFISRSRG